MAANPHLLKRPQHKRTLTECEHVTDTPPRRLFKYQTVTVQSLANLRERTLWCAGPRDFNDPFDCNAAVIAPLPAEDYLAYHSAKGNPEAAIVADGLKDGPEAIARITQGFHDTASQGLREAIARDVHTRGVACLAATYSDILMWAHYANGHRGFCLAFDSSQRPFSSAKRVRYQATAPEVHPIKLMQGEISSDELVDLLMLRKFDTWQYEQEWRVLRAAARAPLSYSVDSLTDIYLGVEMPERERALLRQMLAGAPTRIHDMTRAASGFAVEAPPPAGEPTGTVQRQL